MTYKQDSIQVTTNDSAGTIPQDSIASSNPVITETPVPIKTNLRQVPKINVVSEQAESEVMEQVTQDSLVNDTKQETIYEPFSLFSSLKEKDSSIIKLDHQLPSAFKTTITEDFTGTKPLNSHSVLEKGWILGIAVFSLIIFLIVKIYFQKYLSSIITSTVNIQIAEKLMREKNVLIRRVFTLLNLNFAISASLFLYLVLNRFNILVITERNFLSFLILFGILGFVLSARYIVILIIGNTFNSLRLFREYLHNTYLINKNLGLYLLPLTISIFFLQAPLKDIAFYFSFVIVSISLIYKYIRGLQILMKYKVFLFYSILYLCTLEIVPALVGLKFVLSLR